MTSRSARQQPFTIYTDLTASQPLQQEAYYNDPRMSTSPSPYDADNGLSSDENDSILPSIESPHKARRSSAAFTSVSSIPPSLPFNSDIPPYTPHKGPRPAFRSPSSVRAMQMSSPPPFQSSKGARMGSPLGGRRARGGTPSSIRSGSVLHNVRHAQDFDEVSSISQGHQSGRNTPSAQSHATPTRGPLVLLHVTVLPGPALPYSVESLQELAPSYVLQNCYMLQEKLTETVLTRGVLIPHPGEEFDLLEEGLLETLGLCAPRIGSCGHFYGDINELDSDSGNDSGVSDVGGGGRHAQLKALSERPYSWSTQSDLEDLCSDCEQSIRLPGKGIGSGNSRWELKIYAANGLMRAGAWSAAYREMERVDVEIEPWIPEDVKRALDLRLEKEQDELRKEREELERLRFDLEVMERLRTEADDERSKAEERVRDLEQDLELAKTTTPQTLPTIVGSPVEEELVVPKTRESLDTPYKHTAIPSPIRSAPQEIPLSTLLRNYLILLAQDRRNVALGILSVLVIFMSLRLASSPQAAAMTTLTDTMHPQLGNTNLRDSYFEASPSRDVVEDTDGLTRPAISGSPIAEAMSAQTAMAEAHDNGPKPVASQMVADFVPVESPPPAREGAATISHASVSRQADELSAHGGTVSSESSNVETN